MMLLLKNIGLLLFMFHLTSGQEANRANQETLNRVKDRVLEELTLVPANIGGFVRLAFHDCVGNGHCDGCINPRSVVPDNAGLEAYTPVLNEMYEEFKDDITRADLYAYASVVALELAAGRASRFNINRFKVGRRDCNHPDDNGLEDDENEELPSSNMKNVDEVHSFFNNEFGLTKRETIALMGAHTLGRARTENSGYEGPWVPVNGVNSLNNRYYTEILRPWFLKAMPDNVEPTSDEDNKFQWERRRRGDESTNDPNDPDNQRNILLNTDAALSVDLDGFIGDNGGFVSDTCEMCSNGDGDDDCCPTNDDGHCVIQHYAGNLISWLSDFENVYYKMIDHNDNSLTRPEGAQGIDEPASSIPDPLPECSNDVSRRRDSVRTRNLIDALVEDTFNKIKKRIH